MLEKKIYFILLIPILLAVTINGIPQSPSSDQPNGENNSTSGQPNKTETNPSTEKPNKTETNPSTEKPNKTETNPSTEKPNKTETKPSTEKPNKTETNPSTEKPNKTETKPSTEKPNKTETNPSTEKPNKTETNPSTEKPNKTETNPSTEKPNKTETKPSTEKPNKTETNPSTEQPNNSSTPSQAQPPNELRGYNCPRRNGFFRYPEKCDVYIECKDYIPLTYICPEGLQFNPNAGSQELICDDPSVVKCNTNDPDAPLPADNNQTLVIKVPPGEQNGTPRPILYIITNRNTTDSPINEVTKRPSNVLNGYNCPMKNGVFGYPGTCDVYVKCEDNSPLLYKCTDGLQFNPNPRTPELFCDDPSVVNCNALTALPVIPALQPQNPSPAPSGFNCPSANGYYKYPGRCNEYYECRVYAPMRSVCPFGLHFNPNAQWADYPCVDPLLAGC